MRRLLARHAEALAAEFALGTLRGRARQRFESLSRSEAALRDARRRWEDALTPLALGLAPVEPPARLWRGIEQRIAAPVEASTERPALALWRALGLVAGGLASVMVAALLWLMPSLPSEPLQVAMLNAPDNVPRMMVTLDASGDLRVKPLKPWSNVQGKALELWALRREGAPRSLGLVSNDAETRLRILPSDGRMAGATALAVSLEPPRGSPTGQPTGPLLCSGAIASVRKT